MENNSFDAAYMTPPPAADDILKSNEKGAWQTVLRVGLALATFSLLPQIVALLIALVCRLLQVDPVFLTTDLYLYGVQVLAVYVITIPVCFLILGRPKGDPFAQSPAAPAQKPFRMTILAVIILFCIAEFAAIGGSLIGNALMSLFGALTGSLPENGLTNLLGASSPIAVLLVAVILGPIMEELFFRYGVTRCLLPYGEKTAILFSGLLFGLAHGNFYQFFYTFAIGSLFAFLYIRTKKILYPILFHIAFNFIGGFLPTFFMQILPAELFEGEIKILTPEILATYFLPFFLFLCYTVFTYLTAIAGLVLLCVFLPKQRFAPPAIPLREGSHLRILLLNPGTIVLFLASVLMFTLSLIL